MFRKRKQLGRLTVSEMEQEMTVLDYFLMQGIVAGDGNNTPTWDCLFKTFIYTYQQQVGETLDIDTVVQQYIDKTGHDPRSAGGAGIGSFMSFLFQYGFGGSQNTSGNMHECSVTQWAAFQLDDSGTLHFAIPIYAYVKNGVTWIRCIDPTKGGEEDYEYSKLMGTYDVWLYVDGRPDYGSYDPHGSDDYYA